MHLHLGQSKEVTITDRTIILKRLNVEQYRGINKLYIDDLSQINVFVGENNSGKTSILEAIKIFSDPKNIGQLVALAFQRSSASLEKRRKKLVELILSIFQQGKDDDHESYSIKMSAEVYEHKYAYEADGTVGELTTYAGEEKTILDLAVGISVDGKKMDYTRDRIINDADYSFETKERRLFQSLYLPSSASLYKSCVLFLSQYILKEGTNDVIRVLQSFDSNIEDINIVGDDIYLYNSVSGSMPLFTYGSGLQKAVLLASVILYCQNGTLLIDEIENAIHVSAFEDVFSWFINSCMKYNVQAFITTHSLEAVDALINVVHDHYANDDILRVITLRKDVKNNITRYKNRDGQLAFSDREQFQMELRV